jgi:triphosphoribosyl-dephospho-CoA synthase
MLPIGLCAQLACIWEATARKPGNVHRFADFADTCYLDFLLSAAAIAPVLDRAGGRAIGETVLEAVRETRRVVSTNTNLGIVLLLAPMAAVSAQPDLQAGLERVLGQLDIDDARHVYPAIRLAHPGGLGTVADQDIHNEPTVPLRQAMALAASRDLIARQYANGFEDIFSLGLPALREGLKRIGSLEGAIIFCQLRWLATYPDTLIARKCGEAEAAEASRRSMAVLQAGWPESEPSRPLLADYDAWLRADGHRRNPGTTADLVTACLFAALREDTIQLPLQVPFAMA